MIQEQAHLARILETDSGIDAGYRHFPKRVTPGEPLYQDGAVLKWYGVHPEDRPCQMRSRCWHPFRQSFPPAPPFVRG